MSAFSIEIVSHCSARIRRSMCFTPVTCLKFLMGMFNVL